MLNYNYDNLKAILNETKCKCPDLSATSILHSRV